MKSFKELVESLNENSDLNDALNDLVDRLKHDGYVKGIEHEVAADWDVKPQLLLRMFKQKYNKDPEDMAISNDETKYVVKTVSGHDPKDPSSPLYNAAAFTEDEIIIELLNEEWKPDNV